MNEYTEKNRAAYKEALSACTPFCHLTSILPNVERSLALAIMYTGCPIRVTNRIKAVYDTHPL